MKAIPLIMMAICLAAGCARFPPSGTSTHKTDSLENKTESLGKKEDSESAARLKARNYCEKKGYPGYDQIDIYTSASPRGAECRTVKVRCPVATKGQKKGMDRGACLEYQCAQKATEWTTRMIFQCR